MESLGEHIYILLRPTSWPLCGLLPRAGAVAKTQSQSSHVFIRNTTCVGLPGPVAGTTETAACGTIAGESGWIYFRHHQADGRGDYNVRKTDRLQAFWGDKEVEEGIQGQCVPF